MTNNKARAAPGKVARTVAAAFAAAMRRGDIYMRCPRCRRGILVAGLAPAASSCGVLGVPAGTSS
jgi:hypothetical protein